MPETALVATEQAPAALIASEDFETLRAAVGPDLTNSQLKLALLYAQKVGADLFARDIYPVVVDGRLTFLTSIDFARSRALASGEYQGQGRTEYGPDCSCEGEEVTLARRHPEWAEVPIFREGFLEPMVQRAYFHEYAPVERAKDERGNQAAGWVIKYTWRKMPHVLVAKVSEMLGLRKAFPRNLQGMYAAEEMEQAGVIEGQVQRIEAGTGIEIPPDPTLPEGLGFMGSVYKTDGPRQVKLSTSKALAWASDMGLPDMTHKTEVAFTISRRRHTAVILGDLALAVGDLRIANEETVATDGKLMELDYPGRGQKPMKKELHRITRLGVLRDNAWVMAGEQPDLADPYNAVDDADLPAGDPDPSPGGSSPAGPPTATTEAATASPSSAPIDDMDALLAGTPPEAELRLEGEVLEDVSGAMSLPEWNNDADAPHDAEADILELEQQRTTSGTPFLHAWLREHEKQLARYEGVMSEAEAVAQGVYEMVPGQVVRVVGTWAKAGPRTVVMVTAVVPVTA